MAKYAKLVFKIPSDTPQEWSVGELLYAYETDPENYKLIEAITYSEKD